MKISKYFYVPLALLLVLLCLVPVLAMHSRANDAYDVWYFGDSITACYDGGFNIPEYVAYETGLSVLNIAFGGTTLTKTDSLDETKLANNLSMVEMSWGVRNNDLSLTAIGAYKDHFYYPNEWNARTKTISKASFKAPRYVFVAYGTNDYFAATPLDDSQNLYNEYTFGGALRTVIRNIQTGMPNAKLVLVTPPCNDVNIEGKELSDYIKKELEIAKEFGIAVVDNNTLAGIDSTNYTDYLADGTHPNATGIILLSEHIIEFLKENE